MNQPLSYAVLRKENQTFAGSGGVSQENRARGFIPAFYDTQSGKVEVSRFRNGTPAPIHILDGAPAEWIVARNPSGRVTAIKASVVAGFLHQGRFYTRAQAAQAFRH